MERFSEKVFLQLKMPSEEAPYSDQERIQAALSVLGYDNVTVPLMVLQTLYPMCRDCDYDITVTLAFHDTDWIVTCVEPGDTTGQHYGLAVDYGSTTIVMQLIDLSSGSVIAQEKTVNQQVEYGKDILTRITYSLEDPSHMTALQKATVRTFEALLTLLTEQTGIPVRHCPVMIVSGNTTMVHFLLKLNAWTVFASPYAPVTTDPGWLWGNELGMDFDGLLYFIPAASNYIGGDIISGLLKLDIHKKEKISLFFDIGTNGELVIGCKDWMMAGAGAAGPALEGDISPYGMRAEDGAVDTVKIQGDRLDFTTIGNASAKGICGSGIIDLLAQMRLNGWINIAGDLNPKASSRIIYLQEEQEYAAVYAAADESATGEPLFFSQTDIDQYLDTKAAAYTMIECLMETAGCKKEDLAHCYLSGAFSAHSNLESAITIGIFPDIPRDRYVSLSNTSLDGARILLMDRSRLKEAKDLAENMYCVQFASIPDFLIRMQAAKFIPHTDMREFPYIEANLLQKGQE